MGTNLKPREEVKSTGDVKEFAGDTIERAVSADLPDLGKCQLQQPKSSGALSSSKRWKRVVTITESGVKRRGVVCVGIGLCSGRHI
ncbi:hypothetical protein SAICODRAFT_119611 [Saitoella complicata NRRL Y-17804]|nr:uncharacterized protein SAICODRAFT_119611 [Saitoella complicata NRRL Y-17804]ODQ53258.1 hypothetical protein SAICODRAFT_119611 [Saitoella complicata NRRL Y-17804]